MKLYLHVNSLSAPLSKVNVQTILTQLLHWCRQLPIYFSRYLLVSRPRLVILILFTFYLVETKRQIIGADMSWYVRPLFSLYSCIYSTILSINDLLPSNLLHDYDICIQQIQTWFSGPKFSVAGSITIKGAVFHFPALIPVYCRFAALILCYYTETTTFFPGDKPQHQTSYLYCYLQIKETAKDIR